MSVFKHIRKKDIAQNLQELQNIEDPNTFTELPQEEKDQIIKKQKTNNLTIAAIK